jgi:hypothetical protein
MFAAAFSSMFCLAGPSPCALFPPEKAEKSVERDGLILGAEGAATGLGAFAGCMGRSTEAVTRWVIDGRSAVDGCSSERRPEGTFWAAAPGVYSPARPFIGCGAAALIVP